MGDSPMPTATNVAPSRAGTTNVDPTLPVKPCASSVARFSPSCRGTGPDDPTARPTASAVRGTLRTMETVGAVVS